MIQHIKEKEQIFPVDYIPIMAVINNLPIPKLYNNCTYKIAQDCGGYLLCIYQIEYKFDKNNDPYTDGKFVCTLYSCY